MQCARTSALAFGGLHPTVRRKGRCPWTLALTVVATETNSCKAAGAGAAVYIWHCDINGELLDVHSQGVEPNENYCAASKVGRLEKRPWSW